MRSFVVSFRKKLNKKCRKTSWLPWKAGEEGEIVNVGCGFSIVSGMWEMQMGARASPLAPQCCPLSLSSQGSVRLTNETSPWEFRARLADRSPMVPSPLSMPVADITAGLKHSPSWDPQDPS